MKTNIALIGFMGTGKTTVGRALAKKLNKKFLELDPLIEQRAGITIPQIFEQYGEIGFREQEIAITKEVAERENVVIACGGGLVLNKINIDRLRQKSVMVYLTATPDVILKRTSRDIEERPLLKVDDPALKIQELIEYRQPFYERAADIIIDTSKLDINGVVTEIITRLKQYEGINI